MCIKALSSCIHVIPLGYVLVLYPLLNCSDLGLCACIKLHDGHYCVAMEILSYRCFMHTISFSDHHNLNATRHLLLLVIARLHH